MRSEFLSSPDQAEESHKQQAGLVQEEDNLVAEDSPVEEDSLAEEDILVVGTLRLGHKRLGQVWGTLLAA